MIFDRTPPQFAAKPKRQVGPYVVKGQKASKNEYNVALAAEFYNVPYLFQVTYWGGHIMLGGQVLDFLFWTPMLTPVQVYGEYWHRRQFSSADRYDQVVLEAFIGRPIIILWGNETETFELAKNAFRQKVL